MIQGTQQIWKMDPAKSAELFDRTYKKLLEQLNLEEDRRAASTAIATLVDYMKGYGGGKKKRKDTTDAATRVRRLAVTNAAVAAAVTAAAVTVPAAVDVPVAVAVPDAAVADTTEAAKRRRLNHAPVPAVVLFSGL